MNGRFPFTASRSRSAAVFLAALFLFATGAHAYEDFTVHEWGTFTSVVGSDGVMLPGLEREEHALPAFVRGHAGFVPNNKGWNYPVKGVTVKMETPVLYFYSEQPRSVHVQVDFRGGSISQWFPERSAGEQRPAPAGEFDVARLTPVDFSRSAYRGSASWQVELLPPGTPLAIPQRKSLETREWSRARVPAANRVRSAEGLVEGFIFYRGIGNFALPLSVQADDQGVTLTNSGADVMPFVWVYEKTRSGTRSWTGALAAGEVRRAATDADADRQAPFQAALVRAGLTNDEAKALLHTWRESYFDRPGLRVFWIVPRAFTDEILPIHISPQPAVLERVLVGRTEVLTPKFEDQLARDFAIDGGKRWREDRYLLAYRERAAQLNGTPGVASARGR